MPYANGNIVWNATTWTPEMIKFLRENYKKFSNRELANHLGITLTVTRNKMRELGLKKIQLEYWNDEMIDFLKKSYKTIGDVEIMKFFEQQYPKTKGWHRTAIWKKRKQMGLLRTADEKAAIQKRNHKKGGRCYTIEKNSSSKNLHPRWVAQQIAWRNSELQLELVKHSEIIEAARALILLRRKIKTTCLSQQKK